MPLIDLQTNLKSLKYGLDRPGGGSSGLPYVQFPLPENATGDVLEFYENNRTNLDFPIRGGGFDLGDIGPYVGQAAKFDRIRIQKFLKDSPRGTIFILKQQSLQLSNPKIQVGSQINLDLGVLPFRFVGNLENTRIYNGGKNTIAQVSVQGSGFHFDRHGMIPINPYQQTYNYVANDNNNQLTNNGIPAGNRLYNLYKTKILSQGRIRLDNTEVSIETLNTLGISRNPDLLIQYPGGPTSVGGIGLTTIHRRVNSSVDGFTVLERGKLDQSPSSYQGRIQSGSRTLNAYEKGIIGTPSLPVTNTFNITNLRTGVTIPASVTIPTSSYWDFHAGSYELGGLSDDYTRYYDTADSVDTARTTNLRNLSYTFTYRQLQAAVDKTKIGIPDIKADFRKTIVNNPAQQATEKLASTEGYDGDNGIIKKYGTGNPGSPQLKRVRYNESVDINGSPYTATQDAINMLDVGEIVDSAGNVLKDLVKFRFDTIEVDSVGTTIGAAGTTPLIFRAFLTSFQDNHSAEYTPFRYTGRGENFYAYNGFTRDISFNFMIAAQSRPEMEKLYRKLNYLASQLYPDYQDFQGGAKTGFMRAPLTKLTVGDYIYLQPGFIRSLNISIPDDSPWEIASNEIPGADDKMYQLPHMLDVTCQFTPIHDFLPRRSWIDGSNARHITPLITPNVVTSDTGNNFSIGKR